MPGFVQFHADNALSPHRFEAYRLDVSDGPTWSKIVDCCRAAWRLQADAVSASIRDTGFASSDASRNLDGRRMLPTTPREDSDVTRNSAITDLTESVALVFVADRESGLVLPYPRTLHKDLPHLQHHGIDAIGYRVENGGYVLYVIEIMASVEADHPPRTVRDHHSQIYGETLNAVDQRRLLQDLRVVHDEAADQHKSILNGFIAALLEGALGRNQGVVACPMLFRRQGEFDRQDWLPFWESAGLYPTARIPSVVAFFGIEIQNSFTGLLDLVKQTIGAGGMSDSRHTSV